MINAGKHQYIITLMINDGKHQYTNANILCKSWEIQNGINLSCGIQPYIMEIPPSFKLRDVGRNGRYTRWCHVVPCLIANLLNITTSFQFHYCLWLMYI